MNRWMKAALRRSMPFVALAIGAAALATPANAYLTQSWNGYKWSRTGPLAIQLGDNVSSTWDSYLSRAATLWSADQHIDFVLGTGRTSASTCSPVYGTVQACSANYGATGWLGYATVWTSGGYIVEATVKLNDYYFSQTKYNTTAWRDLVSCQEVGHTLGLAHADTTYSNTNLGTCMDYTSDPTGTKGTNGTLANISPNSTDFQHLDAIYATLQTSQLSYTKPQYKTSDSYGLEGSEDHDAPPQAVPEPSSWMMLMVGFGAIGVAMRSTRMRRQPLGA
jgi:hypothetical protein